MKTQINGQVIHLTEHAQDRYAQRIKHITRSTPTEAWRFARELSGLIERHGTTSEVQPEWVGILPEDAGCLRRADYYVLIGDDICLPIERGVALTVLTKGSFSEERRRERNRRRQEQRAKQQIRRRSEAWLGEKSPRWQ